MNLIEVQRIFKSVGQPDQEKIQQWIDIALNGLNKDTEIVVRIVDEQESAELNEQYRLKPGPTNILTFPFEAPEGIELNLLGDLVICAPVLEKEAFEQHKALTDHWAHIVVHGVLHLLGYDHIDDDEAELMESREIAILGQFNIENPYIQVCRE
ncbi:MAG: rRNA maturation RNase YbeY [Methylococcales bacterium]|nr:rRNA maturation RNase YbeY [Methylococcales bacterium]